MINWFWREFHELSHEELYNLLSLRQEVFMLEQQSLYRDCDFWDQKASHLLGMKEGKLASYLRLLPPQTVYPESYSISRVVTAAFARKQGLMKMAMEEAFKKIKAEPLQASIRLSAQSYLIPCYSAFGFQSEGEIYDDGGIPHIDMVKTSAI